MRSNRTNESFQKIIDWIPLILIVSGAALAWASIDKYALVMNLGFILYGVFELIYPIKKKYYLKFSLKLLKIAGLIAIIVLAVENVTRESSNFLFLMLLILLDRIILNSNRLESDEATP
jgi:hypothetical protein